ncbi:AraC family transcriptional regulator [Streptomyces purpurogeneiscleroticus]|uniref:AraC family transcriptional regulator n=1 Tax=Streptomyces purpurogeneiscleroticus TaxID=68259 RepID=UPI001CC106AA|nr:AraC family transcriptional regulator [Streptomyces purpurogeneiscleroticus]
MAVERGNQESQARVPDRQGDGTLQFRTGDVDRARAWISEVMHYPVTLNPLAEAARFALDMRGMQLGPINANTVTYGTHCLGRSSGLGVAYHINFTITGTALETRRGETFTCTAAGGRLPVFEPTGTVTTEMSDDAEVLALGLDRHAVEGTLEEYLDHPVRPLHFPGGFDPTDGEGRTLSGLAQVLERELRTPTGLLEHEIVTVKLADTLLTTMLYATPHQYHEELIRPAPRTCPRPVKRAIDAMQADPAHAFTMRELAGIAGVAPRSLQAGFQQHMETTPMTYLRALRLERAHRDLTRPGSTETVTEVAVRWGFTHLGRFAAAYRARYGTLPSQARRG